LIEAILTQKAMGIEFTTVMRQSGNETANAIMGNHSDIGIVAARFSEQIGDAGGKTLGVFSAERFPVCPDVPAMVEQGVNVVDEIIRVIAVPGETPDEIVAVIEQSIKEAIATESYAKTLAGLNEIPKFTGSQEITNSMRGYIDVVKAIIQENPKAFD
jgi:tripartite-type tricarboxylate transporter receptor subunit TctC